MQADLKEAIDFHEAIVTEGAKALVGYEREKALANTVLLSEIPTTYDGDEERQVNAGNLLLRGVPGVGKTFFEPHCRSEYPTRSNKATPDLITFFYRLAHSALPSPNLKSAHIPA